MEKVLRMLAIAMVALLVTVCVSCDKKEIDPSAAEMVSGKYTANIQSAVPMMKFVTDCGKGDVRIVASTDSTVDIIIPAYDVEIKSEMQGRPFEMNISMPETLVKDVKVNGDAVSGYTLQKGEFTTQAGDYEINGISLQGTLLASRLNLSFAFRPAGMPSVLNVVTNFEN